MDSFDKPNLGFVVHFGAPQSVVPYYQQVRRAGRAIPEAFGVLLPGQEDDAINRHFITRAFPPFRDIHAVLKTLSNAEAGLSVPSLLREVDLGKQKVEAILKLLAVADSAPVIRDGSRWVRTPNRFQLDCARIERLVEKRLEE